MLRRWRAAWPRRRGRFDPPWVQQAPAPPPSFIPSFLQRADTRSWWLTQRRARFLTVIQPDVLLGIPDAIGSIVVQVTMGDIVPSPTASTIDTPPTLGVISPETTIGTITH